MLEGRVFRKRVGLIQRRHGIAMASILTFFVPFLAILLGTFSYNRGSLMLPSSVSELLGSYIQVPPHYASWDTWFHPDRMATENERTGIPRKWNYHYYLGGNGPWVEMMDEEDLDLEGIQPPEGCFVEQVHMMSRHAERYPTKSVGNRHLALMKRIKETNTPLNGSLSFLNNWTYFANNPAMDFDQLTITGPYAGTLEAFTTGVRFRTRYGHLLPRNARTRFWASDSNRVIETAKYFASGLFGMDWQSSGAAALQVIPETFEQRGNTLTPGDTCLNYLEDVLRGHDNGVNMLALFQEAYAPAIAKRLLIKEQNTALGDFTPPEIYGMQEMCAFETTVRGSSPWCDVFTREEWESFAYARDLIHYYRAGPGTPYAGAMGWLWLNATASLLQSGPEAVGSMFFSFVHDGDIAPFLVALDMFKDPKHDPELPTTHVAKDRVWKTSSVMPMGARIILERLTCPSPTLDDKTQTSDKYVRININDKVKPLPYCRSGPGFSCPLAEFTSHVQRRGQEVGDFGEMCGLGSDVGGITFLHQE